MSKNDDKANGLTKEQLEATFATFMEDVREGAYRFSSKLRGQTGLIPEELIDPEGDVIPMLADQEGDAGALALSIPLELITFQTWLLGQIGDNENFDLDIPSHRDFWFNLGAWIGETLRRRHGGHWLFFSDDPKAWRLGFSKLLLEIAPFAFAHQLLSMGQHAAHKLLSEIETLRETHQEEDQKHDNGALDRFTLDHYIRMHSIPVGQWFVVDFAGFGRLWNQTPVGELLGHIKKQGAKLPGADQVIQNLTESLKQADQTKPLGQQTNDKALFETLVQILSLQKTTQPLPMDILEKFVLPAVHIGIPDVFPPLDDDDIAELNKGIELFSLFVDIVPHQHKADDEGFLGTIPNEYLASPYGEQTNLDVGKGDWVIVDAAYLSNMLATHDAPRLLDSYTRFVKHVSNQPNAPHRRDEGLHLAESVANALGDLKSCVSSAASKNHTLLFRMLPPPG